MVPGYVDQFQLQGSKHGTNFILYEFEALGAWSLTFGTTALYTQVQSNEHVLLFFQSFARKFEPISLINDVFSLAQGCG